MKFNSHGFSWSQFYRALVGAMGILLAFEVHAVGQCYKAIPIKDSSGKEKPVPAVCTTLVQNLNEFCDEPPMVCSLKISPKYPKLSLPKWEEMDVKENIGLIEKLARGGAYFPKGFDKKSSDQYWINFKSGLTKYGNNNERTLTRASLDLLNRGTEDMVYTLDNGYCQDLNFGKSRNEPEWKKVFESRPPSRQYAKVGPLIFLGRHAEILDNPKWRQRAEGGASAFPGAMRIAEINYAAPANVFLYEGQSFLYHWGSMGPWLQQFKTVLEKPDPIVGPLLGYSPEVAIENADVALLCSFEYLGSDDQLSIQQKKGK